MSKWSIHKTFEFCYGHRVPTQILRKDLSIDGVCACRRQHGHNGKVIVYLTSEELNPQGMVMDFRELQWFKKWLDDVLDHKMILWIDDPANKQFYPILGDMSYDYGPSVDRILEYHTEDEYYTIWEDLYAEAPLWEREIYEGLVLVDFVPTSENLSKWLFEIVQRKLGGYATVEKIEFWETPKSCSIYSKS